MDWTDVELIGIENEDTEVVREPLLAGLAASPSDLHDAFLSGLPHLQETRELHHAILETAGQKPEAHFSAITTMQTAEAAIGTMGGHREGDSLVLPLSGAIRERVRLEIAKTDDLTALRINAESHQGASISTTFKLPAGSELGRAGWRGDELIIDLNKK
ncbi:MAG: hypothetical protein QGF94_02690 [Candidatus Thalassarchaeaceae archaeon]|jgi:hypothetical protein|nr:hypothetical protein [Candidatus Thalassarchaeaceae archaeon]